MQSVFVMFLVPPRSSQIISQPALTHASSTYPCYQVSGHDGGTGASPISSIKHAGGPMEMGLAEVHQVLVRNELRERVVVRADGGLRNGRDVLMAAALGADEYGFGTVAMVRELPRHICAVWRSCTAAFHVLCEMRPSLSSLGVEQPGYLWPVVMLMGRAEPPVRHSRALYGMVAPDG